MTLITLRFRTTHEEKGYRVVILTYIICIHSLISVSNVFLSNKITVLPEKMPVFL